MKTSTEQRWTIRWRGAYGDERPVVVPATERYDSGYATRLEAAECLLRSYEKALARERESVARSEAYCEHLKKLVAAESKRSTHPKIAR